MKIRHTLFLLGFLLTAALPAFAQNGTPEGDWYEDEDSVAEETVAEPAPTSKMRYEDALIHINGDRITPSSEYSVDREDTLDIQVRQLAPGSPVTIEVKKGGINLKRKTFYANNRGELDLEVKTGSKKGSGDAVLYYTPAGNSRKILEVHLTIE